MATKAKAKSNLISENQVLYKPVLKKNYLDKTKAAKYYAQVQNTGRVSLRTIEEELEQSSSVTRGDVMSIISNLEVLICKCLRNGNVVQLGDIGTFRVSVSSKGAASAKDFTAQNITKARINFRAGVGLTSLLTTLKYAKMGEDGAATTDDKGKTDGGGTKTDTGGGNTGGNTGGDSDGGKI
jgi:predicted histone-like DNA-binding protein